MPISPTDSTNQFLVTGLARVGSLLFLFAALPLTVQAATIQVNSIADVIEDTGFCTLREAIIAANTDTPSGATSGECTAGSGPDGIVFLAPGTIVLNGTQLPTILEDLTILGLGAEQQIIDGNDQSRILEIDPGVVVELTELTLTSGDSQGPDGGGILNNGQLTVGESILSNNFSDSDGGGIFNTGSLTVWGSGLLANSAVNGAGIFSAAGSVELFDTALVGNFAFGGGGGIGNGTSALTVDGCTFADNTAFNGGALVTNGAGWVTTIVNSTFSGNTAGNRGGGIFSCCAVTLTIENATLTENRADSQEVGGVGGGLLLQTPVINLLTSIIVAGNVVGTGTTPDDIDGEVDPASSFNVIGVDTGLSGITNGVNGNQIGTAANPLDARLDVLSNNGGPTDTHALLAGSPAIDEGSPLCPPPTVDQRGFPRDDGACDVGAYEVGAAEIFADGFESGDTSAWSTTVP